MSDWGLSGELHISPKEANLFSQKYFEVFPEVKPYLDNCIKETKERGYTTTFIIEDVICQKLIVPMQHLESFQNEQV